MFSVASVQSDTYMYLEVWRVFVLLLGCFCILQCFTGNKDGCSHESEEDDTDVSDLEDGEIRDSDDEDGGRVSPSDSKHSKEPKHSTEVQARLNHPERLDKNLCYNDRGEVGDSDLGIYRIPSNCMSQC